MFFREWQSLCYCVILFYLLAWHTQSLTHFTLSHLTQSAAFIRGDTRARQAFYDKNGNCSIVLCLYIWFFRVTNTVYRLVTLQQTFIVNIAQCKQLKLPKMQIFISKGYHYFFCTMFSSCSHEFSIKVTFAYIFFLIFSVKIAGKRHGYNIIQYKETLQKSIFPKIMWPLE